MSPPTIYKLTNAAAHMVDIPSKTPKDVSMASPAIIKSALSMMPKAIKGMQVAMATARKSSRVGSGTVNDVEAERAAERAE